MKNSIRIKSILASFVYSSGLIHWTLRRDPAANIAILMYHRIIPASEVSKGIQAGMYVKPETFEVHIQFLKKYFKIIPLSDLVFNAKRQSKNFIDKPFCILTFDDGWHDFHDYAYPILKKHGTPATIFLPTDFIGTSKWFWTDRLTYLFLRQRDHKTSTIINQPSKNPLINELEKPNGSRESLVEQAIEMLKVHPVDEIESILSELSKRWNLNYNPPGHAFLSWEEVREMRLSGLISYGSHTASHRILTTLTEKEIKKELIDSKEKLIGEKAVDKEYIPFCYPNGNYNKNISGMVKEAGYSLAVTTESGWNTTDSNSFCLRRIPIHQDMTSTEAMFGCRIAGII